MDDALLQPGGVLYPPDKGDKIASWNILKPLACLVWLDTMREPAA
jgi:hypothetical protein